PIRDAPQPVEEVAEEDESLGATRIEWRGGPIYVAIVGRPNVGKSSLVNRLLGEERMLADDAPGTTRDAVDSQLVHEGHEIVLIDTAGMRRQRAIDERIERYAVFAAMRSMERADIVVLVLDATQPVAVQDARIVSLAEEHGKAIVLVVNKWDRVTGEARKAFLSQLGDELRMVSYAPVLQLSAKTGKGIGRLLPTVLEAQRERHRRVGTAELNRFFRSVIDAHPPPYRANRRPKLYYVSQPLVRPPTFIVVASHPESIDPSYGRYLQNSLRERYGFRGTPLWVKFRSRGTTS
ncbi:MAG: ribosome biogenesis GTPase Der, partial [Myxococcota bacterium]